jgi:hypothetical protein
MAGKLVDGSEDEQPPIGVKWCLSRQQAGELGHRLHWGKRVPGA